MAYSCIVLRGENGITLKVTLSSYGWVNRIVRMGKFYRQIDRYMKERGVSMMALKKGTEKYPTRVLAQEQHLVRYHYPHKEFQLNIVLQSKNVATNMLYLV